MNKGSDSAHGDYSAEGGERSESFQIGNSSTHGSQSFGPVSKKPSGTQRSSHSGLDQRANSFQSEKLVKRVERFEAKNAKGAKKKGKKKFKWDNAESHSELLGFDQYGPSPFEPDTGYSINDVDIYQFKQRPIKKRGHKGSHFSVSQHVQANHRFILKPNRNQDYFFATYDHDYFVEWDDIFMVLAKRNSEYLCPICREEDLVCPVISKCGHIFCWPCILHYMLYASENEGEGWRKCPLCEELVFKDCLKFAKVYIKTPPVEKGKATFKLAFRNKASSVVKYYEESDSGKEERNKFENLEVFYNDSEAYNITRIRVCQEYDLIFDQYRTRLNEDCKEAENLGDTFRVSFCQEALESIDELSKEIQEELEFIYQQRALKENNMDEIDQSDNSDQKHNLVTENPESSEKDFGAYDCLANTQKREKYETIAKESSGSYFFFQLNDETNSFLDPLCMRVLLKEYGSYSNLPLKITSTILEIEEYNMTEALRNKYKPIGHLPLAAEFKFIEIDLSNLVSYETYETFEKQIRTRENLRKRRIVQEKKYNDKAKLIEEKKYELYLRTNLEVNTKRLSKIVPEWATGTTTKDDTWFTLDGKEIKSEKKPQKAWEGDLEEAPKEEVKESPAPDEESNKENADENVWDDFQISAQGEPAEEFPVLGGNQPKKEKIPVILSKKLKPKKANKDSEEFNSEFIASRDAPTFSINEFIVQEKHGRGRKKKGRRR